MTDEEVKEFVALNFSECVKSTKEEQNLRKVAKSFYIFLTTSAEVEKYVQLYTVILNYNWLTLNQWFKTN